MGRGLPAPKHPQGRKRRSGWDSGTDTKGWTRELACDEWKSNPSVSEVASDMPRIGFTGGAGRSMGGLMMREDALALGSCLDISPNWVDIETRVITHHENHGESF